MTLRFSIRGLSVYETAYLAARAMLTMVFTLVSTTGQIELIPPAYHGITYFAWALSTFTTICCLVALVFLRVNARSVLLAATLPDLVGIALAIVATQGIGDPAFVWVLGFAVVYALLLPMREAIPIICVVSTVYFAAYAFSSAAGEIAVPWATQITKTASIGVLGYFTADTVRRHAVREAELVTRQKAIEELNTQLEIKVAELGVVSEITEIIHSSLDFDFVGSRTLETIREFIDAPGCGLLVFDKEANQVLFNDTSGEFAPPDPMPSVGSRELVDVSLEQSSHCLTLLDGERLKAVFFAPEESIRALSSEYKLVLQTVSSELAVAAENSRLYRLTKRLSVTDELTGLHNYRYFHQRLDEEFERAQRHERPLSLLMLDIDDFKVFNDHQGHPTGDAALADLGKLLSASVRENDVVARYGGEEFAAILPETDGDGALAVAEKVREAIGSHAFADAGGNAALRLTASLGVANYPLHAEDKETLVCRTDEALYQAKRFGRDRVRVAASRPVAKE